MGAYHVGRRLEAVTDRLNSIPRMVKQFIKTIQGELLQDGEGVKM